VDESGVEVSWSNGAGFCEEDEGLDFDCFVSFDVLSVWSVVCTVVCFGEIEV